MKIFYLGSAPVFYCVPREYPKVTDSIKLVLRDEQTSEEYILETEFLAAEKLRIEATTLPYEFVSQQKFDLSLLIDDKTIYKGKLMILDQNTDVQNFTYGDQTSGKYEFNR